MRAAWKSSGVSNLSMMLLSAWMLGESPTGRPLSVSMAGTMAVILRGPFVPSTFTL